MSRAISTTLSSFRSATPRKDGANSFVYFSDWPHWNYDRPSTITNLPILLEDEKAQVMGRNVEELFGI